MHTRLRTKLFLLSTGLAFLAFLVSNTWVPSLAQTLVADPSETQTAVRWLIFSGVCLALAIALVVSTIAGRRVSQATRSLILAAESMSKGDFSAHARVQGTDELSQLGQALDRLAGSFSKSLRDLRSERDFASGVLSAMQEAVLLVNAEGIITLTNPALREMFFLRSDVVGKRLMEAIRRADLREIFERAKEQDERVLDEMETPGLKPKRLLVHAARMPNEPAGVLFLFVDVTQLRKLESMRRDFAANVSHELRTPLTAIQGAAETLRSALLQGPDVAMPFVDIIDRHALRLRDLVEDVLELSRIDAREYRFEREPLDLAAIFNHIVSSAHSSAAQKQTEVIAEVEEGLASFVADKRAVELIVGNIIENAIKYCPPSSRVHLRVGAGEKGIRIVVEDNGPGIAEQHLDRIFERFYRVQTGRTREVVGTGLGLSIVKNLTEAMGGSVQVESQIGRGTTFIVWLPRGA